jgi:HD superfamily phosphohydrolase
MKLIYDPLYGYIGLEDYLLEIIDTAEFQRLRDIKQLGCAYIVFPSAVHTRFEHSIGVAHLSGIFIKSIQEKQPELNISENDIRRIKIAGLIHDLGHSCYSHFFDHHFLSDLNNPLKDHELRSIHILKYIKNKYNLRLTEEDINEITRMIMPSIDDGFKYQIVCNEKNGYDTDKLDYLNRDCHHLGLPYKYDYTRILKQIKVIDNQICFPIKQLSNVYELFELRYKLHQQVYQHPVISCAEMMILDIFKLSHLNDEKEEYISDPEKFRRLSDDYINHIYYTTDNINLKDIYERFKSRRMYKFYGDFEEDTDISIPYKYKLKIKINFGKGDKNPLEFINFYEDNKIIKIDLNKHMILIPNKYEINKFRFIY